MADIDVNVAMTKLADLTRRIPTFRPKNPQRQRLEHRRNMLIVALREAGVSPQVLAIVCDMTPTGIVQIISHTKTGTWDSNETRKRHRA